MLRPDEVIAHVSMVGRISVADLTGFALDRDSCNWRSLAIYLVVNVCRLNHTEAAGVFNRERSSITHAITGVRERAEADTVFARLIASMELALEYRTALAATGGVDTLAVAERVAVNPRRQSVQVSAQEVTALAFGVIDLWEIASAAEAILPMIGDAQLASLPAEDALRFHAIQRAILNAIDTIAGPDAPATPERT